MIAIDSPVLIDLLADGPHADAAEACLRQCLSAGPVVVCDVALAEICGALRDGAEALAVLEDMSIRFSPLEAKSALRAGEMQRRYRQRRHKACRTSIPYRQCLWLLTRPISAPPCRYITGCLRAS